MGDALKVAHLTTVDMSLDLLLGTELEADVAAGHEVLGISAPGAHVGRIERLGVRHVPLRSLTRSWDVAADGRAAHELWRVLRQERPDVLHTHNPKTGVIGRVVGRLTRVPVIVNTCHGLWADHGDPLPKRALVIAAEAFAAQFSHAELYQNAADQRALRWAVPQRRATLVGNGVDLTRFAFDEAGRARLRAELGVSEDELLVGGVGRRVPEKGLPELAAVARRMEGRVRFVWIGPPDDSRRSRMQPAEVDGLELHDARDDMPAVYSALDIFVLPTHREGFSRSAMEAAACERPMILTDIRGCREIGRHEEHLLLVPPRNPAALACAIRRLIDDPGLASRLAAAAAERAQVEFDQRRVAAASLATYERLLARRRGRSR